MEISVQMVREAFEKVLSGAMSRETADRWAHSIIRQADDGFIEYVPPSDEKRIWSGLMYLYGIDSKESPDDYLHSDQDIRTAMHEKLGV